MRSQKRRRKTTRGHGAPVSADAAVHHEVHRGAAGELADGALLHRRVNLDLPHVGVAAVLVVRQNRDLDHEGADGLVVPLTTTTTNKES